MYDLPAYVWALVLTGVIGIPATTSVMLYRGAIAAGLGRRPASTVTVVAAAGLGGWILASGLLARAGIYHQEPGHFRPWIGLAFAGYLTALLAASRIPTVARILAAPGSLARLTLPHTLRVVGVLFLLVMALGHLPAIFALPAGLGDIAVGLAAPSIARRLTADGDRTGAVRFHQLGILDLVVAITIGYLAGLGPYRPLDIVPSTEPLSLLPLALVATVAVPTAIALHIVSLTRLHAADGTTTHEAEQLQPGAHGQIETPMTGTER
jgi:hypothetical protein